MLILLGLGLLGYGVLVELQVRAEVGSGFYRAMAHLFYSRMIEEYRAFSRLCLVLGPGLVLLACFLPGRSAGGRDDARCG